jgi:PEP-CTERM motif
MKKTVVSFSIVAAALTATPSFAAVIVTDGRVVAGALASVTGGSTVNQSNVDSFTGKVRSLKTSVTSTSTNPAQQVVSSATSVSAIFKSASAGSVIVNLSRNFQGINTSGSQNNQGDGGASNFIYRFTPTVNTVLNLMANVTAQGSGRGLNLFGFQGFRVTANGITVLNGINVFDPTFSGATSVNLDRGVLYTLAFDNFSNVSGALPSDLNGSVRGELTFNIGNAAVPEPATWAMMIVGFGLIGGAMRRRKATVRIAFN